MPGLGRGEREMSETGSVHGIVVAGAYPAARSTLDALSPRPLLPVAHQPLITFALLKAGAGVIDIIASILARGEKAPAVATA